MAVVHGIAGMRDDGDELEFDPHTWPELEHLRFPLSWHGQTLEVSLTNESVTYSLRQGSGLTIRHRGRAVDLTEGNPATIPLAD